MPISKISSLSMFSPLCFLVLLACTPTVKLQAPDKPIVINLNVKVQQEVQVNVQKDVEKLMKQRPDIF